MKKALITGITGQDGSYLAEFLLEKGYEVHGLIRRSSISNTGRIDHLIRENKIVLHGGDLSDSSSLVRIIGEVRPDEIYNLGAQSHVQVSFEAPEYAGDVDALELNEETVEVTVGGEAVKLTPMEFKIVQLLIKNPGRVFSADEIYERIWNEKAVNTLSLIHI